MVGNSVSECLKGVTVNSTNPNNVPSISQNYGILHDNIIMVFIRVILTYHNIT